MKAPLPDERFKVMIHFVFSAGIAAGMALATIGRWGALVLILCWVVNALIAVRWWRAHIVARRDGTVPDRIYLVAGTCMRRPDGSIVAIGPSVVKNAKPNWYIDKHAWREA